MEYVKYGLNMLKYVKKIVIQICNQLNSHMTEVFHIFPFLGPCKFYKILNHRKSHLNFKTLENGQYVFHIRDKPVALLKSILMFINLALRKKKREFKNTRRLCPSILKHE
jgi:hypothetical protein